jgi:hypothetical protein
MSDPIIVENLSPDALWLRNQDRHQLVTALGDHPDTSWLGAIERVRTLAREERAWRRVPTLRRRVIEVTAASLATAGIDWDDAHEIDGACSGDGAAECGDVRVAYVDGECAEALSIGWEYSSWNYSLLGSVPCSCQKCGPFWNAPNCTDIGAQAEGGVA